MLMAFSMRTNCGTPSYCPPEVLLDANTIGYSAKVDLWCCGCVMYILLAGYPPFQGCDMKQLFEAIKTRPLTFGESSKERGPWKGVSSRAKDFLARLLEKSPLKRLSALEALRETWVRDAFLYGITISMSSRVQGRQLVGKV